MKKLYTLAISLVAGLCLQAQDKKPNILFIIADDFNPKLFDSNEHRQKQIKTPNLDALASESTVFENSHIMGSWTGAVCMASRTALNTGLSIWKAHKFANNASVGTPKKKGKNKGEIKEASPKQEEVQTQVIPWSEAMQEAGYYTYMTGKWHVNSLSLDEIFDDHKFPFAGMFGGTPKYGYNRPIEGQEDKWDASDPTIGGFWLRDEKYTPKGTYKHATAVTADTAIEFLSNYKGEAEKPFFAYVAFNAPHDPRQAPKEYMDMYDLEGVQVPANFVAENANAKVSGARSIRDESLAPYPRTEFAIKTHLKEYYGSISYLDYHIGRVIKALEDANFDRETIIIFTADHGLAVGEHGYVGKQNMYEASNKTPLFIKGGAFKPSTRVKECVYMQDIMPTTIEIGGGKIPASVDFKSLVPFTKNQNHKQYDSIYASYIESQKMILKDGFKLIRYPKGEASSEGTFLFFNLSEDPEELNDLINDPKYAAKIAEYKDLLAEQDKHFKSLKL